MLRVHTTILIASISSLIMLKYSVIIIIMIISN